MSNIGFCFHMVFENQIVYTEPTLYRCISMAYSKNQFQNKIQFFCFFFTTSSLSVALPKLWNSALLFFTSLCTKPQNQLMAQSNFEAVILFSTKKLRTFFIFHFELSNSFTNKLAWLKMEEHLKITEPTEVLSKTVDKKLIIKCLESFKNCQCSFTEIKSFFANPAASSLYNTQYL